MASILVLLVLIGYLAALPSLHFARKPLEQEGLLSPNNAVLTAVWDAIDFGYGLSILTRLETILRTGFAEPAFSPQVWFSLFGALACFVTSWAIFNRCTEYVDASSPVRGIVPAYRGRRFSIVTRPWRWPLVWKDFHFVSGGPLLTAAKFVAYPLLLAVIYWQQDWIDVITDLEFDEAAWATIGVIAGAELLLYSTRIFRQERKWGTLPCLALLPRSFATIGYAKLAGCLLGSIPTMLVIGMLYWVDPIVISGSSQKEFVPVVAMLVVVLLLVLQLTAYYSLAVPWGALPLALATLLVAGTCIVPVLAAAVSAVATAQQGDYAQLGPILYTGAVLSAVLQLLIAIQFRAAAGE
jgi:hypothetical protein